MINVKGMGIGTLNLEVSATGARLLVIPEASSGEKADKLAHRLREVLHTDVVQISRPFKMDELIIMDLDDATTPEK